MAYYRQNDGCLFLLIAGIFILAWNIIKAGIALSLILGLGVFVIPAAILTAILRWIIEFFGGEYAFNLFEDYLVLASEILDEFFPSK